jgi:hypothetical protein
LALSNARTAGKHQTLPLAIEFEAFCFELFLFISTVGIADSGPAP